MKVLWFTNIELPELSMALGRQSQVIGGWMSALLEALRTQASVELAVATMVPGQRVVSRHVVNTVTYYGLPSAKHRAEGLSSWFASSCNAVLEEFRPDIIHVHGTEDCYGLYTASLRAGPPTVVSIQGLVHVYRQHVGGGITLAKALEGGQAGLLSWLRYEEMQHQWAGRGRRERTILAQNRYFIGRTGWDQAHLLANNPAARYFHGDELLRPAFYKQKWEWEAARRASIFCTAAHSPLKGFHLVLDAMSMLKDEFPEITVRVAGAPWNASRGFGFYGRYLKSLIDRRGLTARVTALPPLGAEQVASELASAAAFAIPSLIENSPNSLAEAMLVGTPCVAALVGGIPSMIEDGQTALGFQSGDATYLAHCLRRVLKDEALSRRLSTCGRAAAVARHNAGRLVADQLSIYRQVIAEARNRAVDALQA